MYPLYSLNILMAFLYTNLAQSVQKHESLWQWKPKSFPSVSKKCKSWKDTRPVPFPRETPCNTNHQDLGWPTMSSEFYWPDLLSPLGLHPEAKLWYSKQEAFSTAMGPGTSEWHCPNSTALPVLGQSWGAAPPVSTCGNGTAGLWKAMVTQTRHPDMLLDSTVWPVSSQIPSSYCKGYILSFD